MSSCSILEVMEGFSFNVVRNSSTADTWATPLASRCRFSSSKGAATSSRGSDGTTSMVMVLAAATDGFNGSATVQSWCLLLHQMDSMVQPQFNHGACCCTRWIQWSSHGSIMVPAASPDGFNSPATVQSWCLLLKVEQMD